MIPKRLACLLLVLTSPLCMGFSPPVLTDSDIPAHAFSPAQLSALEHQQPPVVSAPSVILVNDHTGEIVYALNEHERRAPASFTKIVTALVAMERGRLDTMLWVNESDLLAWSSSGMLHGDRYSLEELLYILLLPSDNAASLAIARGLGKDTETFVGWMNDKIDSWGLQDTHLRNPHGLDSEGSYTTAYDMAIITHYAMQNRLFADIVKTPQTLAGRWVENTNELLDTYPGTIGVKTGTTDWAGECLATMVDRPAGRVMCVIMGSSDRYLDSRLLLDYYFATFYELRVTLPENDQNRYLDQDGGWHQIQLEKPMTYLIHPSLAHSVSLYRRIDNLSSTPEPGSQVGVLQVSIGGDPFTEIPLYVP